MSMQYIRETYNVPAKRGGRVRYAGKYCGTITGARGAHLRIRLDRDGRVRLYHPTWEIEYL
jgi:hypothetical protein